LIENKLNFFLSELEGLSPLQGFIDKNKIMELQETVLTKNQKKRRESGGGGGVGLREKEN